MKYVIITPVRNEEKYLEHTVKSVISQTIKPIEWVIVNDGSSDRTGIIIDSYSKQFQWIRPVHRKNRGYRKSGGGVIEAFYDGYEQLRFQAYDFIVKLDGDLSFDPDYFERLFCHFRENPELGIAGGMIYHVINGTLKLEKNPIFHVRGATKVYKKDCWDALGGLLKAPGWDTLDEVKANMLGWRTKSFSDLKIIHHRYTGAADGTWSNWVKNGRANYISGYHPLFMLFKCIKRTFQKPYLLVSLGLFWGFLSGYLKRISQVNDSHLINYLRKQQINRMFGKETIWR